MSPPTSKPRSLTDCVQDLAPSCPKFVATQAPLTVTMTDFWAMVFELGSEVIVQITSEYETSKVRCLGVD